MTFLVGLNDSFAHARGDQQVVKSKQGKKDRPICSHYGVLGHTMDRCFKIHGYPPGFKAKPRNVSTSHAINQISEASHVAPTSSTGLNDNLTASQCQQLISLLTNQMATITPTAEIPDSTTSLGEILFDEDWHG
ncbi:hypothetical protein SESBI_49749 [Sesbania bispinosa]|nr:hypothetical protein SESBI_49749 [Sesbania bispinosa]